MGDILFLAHRVPYPPDRGDKIRAHHILRHLAARSRVHLAAFADDPRDLTVPDALRSELAGCAIVPRNKLMWRAGVEALVSGRPVSLTAFADPAMRAAVDGLLRDRAIDAIYVFSSQMAQYLPAHTEARIVMDFCDVDAAKFAEYGRAGGPKGWLMRREGRLLLAHDARMARNASANLFVSEAEAALFRDLTGIKNVQAVSNGIDTVRFDPAASFDRIATSDPLIVFTGQMDYAPNIAAVRWFAEDILPRIRAEHPTARFAIVGRAPTAAVRALAALPGVEVTGEVPDVRGWVAAANVVVAPLKLARGVQNKVLEAMAMARPVVASAAAAEGIDHAGTIATAADATDFAAKVAALLGDRAAGDALGAAARARVVDRYGWDACLTPLDDLLGLSAARDRVAA